MSLLSRRNIILVAAITLSACGGGGGSSDNNSGSGRQGVDVSNPASMTEAQLKQAFSDLADNAYNGSESLADIDAEVSNAVISLSHGIGGVPIPYPPLDVFFRLSDIQLSSPDDSEHPGYDIAISSERDNYNGFTGFGLWEVRC